MTNAWFSNTGRRDPSRIAPILQAALEILADVGYG